MHLEKMAQGGAITVLSDWRPSYNNLQVQRNHSIPHQFSEVEERPWQIELQRNQEQHGATKEQLTVQYEGLMGKLTEVYPQRAKKHWALHKGRNKTILLSCCVQGEEEENN